MASPAWSLLMLLVVMALIPLVLWALKRLQNLRPAGAPRPLELAGQLALGPRERVVLVRLNQRMLVLGVTPQQVTLLAEDAAAGFPASASAAAGHAFAGVLGALTAARPGAPR
ncbi:flagellar biosynthetic protein FliO [Ramlibacter alkalitolerans]|uniref:Flagellar protein n=1 Tax=Ramlibacter alkalitolerans TaxID=2039631 RepID=A0ABS1JKW9_9BURK|nr:flagellar biosynthetic protein FliO [Ramlibacter alkalitolerans]MBL0424892.1 flagellar biosynthetic protein FliO [Ramlibacter alkalitolerans]